MYAVNDIKIEIDATPSGVTPTLKDLSGLISSMGLNIDGKSVTKTFFQKDGWDTTFMVGKTLKLSFEGSIDFTNDAWKYLQTLVFGAARNQNNQKFTITFPKGIATSTSGAKLEIVGAINFSDVIGGSSEDEGQFKFDLMISDVPIYSPEA